MCSTATLSSWLSYGRFHVSINGHAVEVANDCLFCLRLTLLLPLSDSTMVVVVIIVFVGFLIYDVDIAVVLSTILL